MSDIPESGQDIPGDQVAVPGALSIVDILAAAVARVTQCDSSAEESRFPVVVTGKTRAFLQANADALGTSLAGLCGTILNEVAVESMRRAADADAEKTTDNYQI